MLFKKKGNIKIMIYVITHKVFEDNIVDRKHYKILHVGANNNCKLDYLRDDTGDNITQKNPNFCELTGLYWIWKNGNEDLEEITGLVHYRRYFTTPLGDLLYTYLGIKPKILQNEKVENAIKLHDIILPKRINIMRTLKEFYADLHYGEDLNITREVVSDLCSDYLEAYDAVMNEHYFYHANMMICKKRYFDEYSKWLFKIMFALEERIDINKYKDSYQKRVFGFISERLLQVWAHYRKLNIIEYPAFNTEERRITIFEKNFNRLKKIPNKIKCSRNEE